MLILTLLLLLAGTTTATAMPPRVKAEPHRVKAAEPLPLLSDQSPNVLTDEMKRWAQRIAPPMAPPDLRLRLLLHALLVAKNHSLEEITGYTPTAAEAFKERRANCVAFAHLLVALSREVGLATYFVMESEPDSIEESGDLRLVVRHLAVGYGPPHRRWIMDFAGVRPARGRRIEVLSDRTALAVYYSNRGAELLIDGALDAAITWLERAVELDADLGPIRNNLEVALYRRAATRPQPPAEQPFLTAVRVSLP